MRTLGIIGIVLLQANILIAQRNYAVKDVRKDVEKVVNCSPILASIFAYSV